MLRRWFAHSLAHCIPHLGASLRLHALFQRVHDVDDFRRCVAETTLEHVNDCRLLAVPHGARLAPPKADGSDRYQAQSRRTHPWRGGLSTAQKPGRNKEAVSAFRLSRNAGAEGISALRKAPLHQSSIFRAYEMTSRCPKRTSERTLGQLSERGHFKEGLR